MKANRLLESPKSNPNAAFSKGVAFESRLFQSSQEAKTPTNQIEEKISEIRSHCFSEEMEEKFSLGNEFSAEEIARVVAGCQTRMSSHLVGKESWTELSEYLVDQLWEFGRLKEDFDLAERKCGMVRQKMTELSRLPKFEVSQTRVMACAMLLAETELRRDNLRTRISGIVDSFVKLIMSEFEGTASFHAMEIRLRAVFASL